MALSLCAYKEQENLFDVSSYATTLLNSFNLNYISKDLISKPHHTGQQYFNIRILKGCNLVHKNTQHLRNHDKDHPLTKRWKGI